MKRIHLILASIFTLFIMSCNSDDSHDPVPLTIAQEIKDLILYNGDESTETVVINVQSGGDIELATEDINFLRQSLTETDVLYVNVHQGQTLNPSLVTGTDISLDEAIAINSETIEILSRVITYFKEQGRKVYVFGFSFGAFVTQELISQKGIDIADKYLIMTGRLDLNDIIWQALVAGRYSFFENGVSPVLEDELIEDTIDKNLGLLAAGIAKNRYTQQLSAIQDLSKITYIYGKTDEAVGRLTESEVQFLVSRNANIIVGEDGHDETLLQFFVQGFEVAFGIE